MANYFLSSRPETIAYLFFSYFLLTAQFVHIFFIVCTCYNVMHYNNNHRKVLAIFNELDKWTDDERNYLSLGVRDYDNGSSPAKWFHAICFNRSLARGHFQ